MERTRTRVLTAVAITLMLAACTSPPKLRMLDPQAVEKAINTPEAAAELKRKHGAQ